GAGGGVLLLRRDDARGDRRGGRLLAAAGGQPLATGERALAEACMSEEFSRTRSEGCLSDLAIDRLVRGEGSGEMARAHLATCENCRARVADIQAARAEFQKAAPSLPSLPADRGSARPKRRWAVFGGGGAVLAAAAAALILFVRGADTGTRIKGGAR